MYRIQNKTDSSLELLLYSDIYPGSTATSIIAQLKEAKNVKAITLRINSDGGDVFEALALYNYLKGLNAEITVMIDGIAASAASIVACAGRVIMPRNAMIMIHNPFGMVQGDSEEMRAMAEVMDKVKESIITVYEAKTGQDKDQIAEMMAKETWLNAYDARTLGFCDEILDPEPEEDDTEATVALMAVKAERERLKALDALMTPERRGIINKAKYETYQSAQDIALELLQIQARHEDNAELEGLQPRISAGMSADIEAMSRHINARRGY